MTDITVRDEGTLLLFTGQTEGGETWLEEKLDPACQRWGLAYVVERRYAQDIIDGANDDGLVVLPA